MTLAWAGSAAGLAAAACFAWLASPIPPRNALSFFLFYLSSASITGLVVVALLYVAVTLWIGLAIMVIGEMFERLRHQQGPDAWQVIFRGLAASLCLPPLIIAAAVGATPIAAGITVLLGISLARLLKVRGRAAAESEAMLKAGLLFGNNTLLIGDISFWRFGLPFLCSLSGQLGIVAILTHHRFLGTALLGLSAAAATWIFPFGKLKQYASRADIVRQMLRLAVVAAFVVLFTVAGIARYMGMVRGSGVPVSFLQVLFGGPAATSTPSRQEPLPKQPGKKGDYPGVILLPDPEQAVLLVPPVINTFDSDSLAPSDIEFTGVYWVLRPPDHEPPKRSPVIRASPAKVVLRSVDRMPLWMEARQSLRRPIDLNCCGAMQVVIANADRDAGMVSIEAVLSGSQGTMRASQSLGHKFLSTAAELPGDAPVEETLSFDMPRRSAMQQFDEIIVRFHLYGRRSTVSAKMAIKRFRFRAWQR